LVHISTDYVFLGELDPERAARGGYSEEDPVGPTRNAYAQSKLEAEREARRAPKHLIVRTSFRPREWPYATGFVDVRTSQGYVDEIAPEIALAALNVDRILAQGVDLLHIAGEPTTVFELARRRKPDVLPASKAAAGVDLPDDIVLNSARWRALKASLPPLEPSS
jgi:dTDP-4-dehydrorhamnose reductase